MRYPKSSQSRILALLLVLGLLLGACAPAAPASPAPAASEPAASEPVAAPAASEPAAPVADAPAAVEAQPEAEMAAGLPDLAGREVVAVTGNDYIPLNFVDPADGVAKGWEYDAVEEICRRLNCMVSWNVTAWDTMIAAVADNQFDVGMDGITITEERATQVAFSTPYMTSQQFMLVRADESRFTTAEEFAADPELLVGSQTGTTGFYTAVYSILDGDEANPRIILLENFGATVQALLAGDVDMVLVDAASGRGYIGANPDKLKIVGDALGSEDFGFIFNLESDLTGPFNAAIESMKADGYLDYLNTKWFFLTDTTGADLYDSLPDLAGREVLAVTGNDYIPLNFVDPKDGVAKGWEYDAVEEICRRLNCAVSWNVTAWDTMIAAVAGNQFDVGMDGITITPERATQVAFSVPYMTSQQFMLVRADEDRFATGEEFAANEDLLIGTQAGTTNFYTAVEMLGGDETSPRIKLLDTFGAAVQALLNGDVDMVTMDASSIKGYIGANPDELKVVGDPLSSEDFGFIFEPGSDLVAPFNVALTTMLEDGYLDHLNTKWFFLYDPGAK